MSPIFVVYSVKLGGNKIDFPDYYLFLVVSVSTHTFKYALKSKKLTNDYNYPHLFILYIQPLYFRTFVVMFNLNAFPDISDLFHSTCTVLS